MKKIPTLFVRVFENHKLVGITPEVTPGFGWVLAGEGEATVKWDGSCTAVFDGKYYKRFDAKKGKTPPAGAIPCCDPDPTTGHWPHWVEVDPGKAEDKWYVEAYNNTPPVVFEQWPSLTYEAVGPHFQGNPYNLMQDILFPHGVHEIPDENFEGGKRTFESIRKLLQDHRIEGIVFWKDGQPQCKIKRTDFGIEWPVKWEEKGAAE